MGEGESDQNVTKNKIWRYPRARWITAELRDSSAMGIEARVREIAGDGELLERGREKGEGMGVWLGFIGRGCCGVEGRERGTAMAFHSAAFHVARWLAVVVAPLAGI